jgi:DNA processing protein
MSCDAPTTAARGDDVDHPRSHDGDAQLSAARGTDANRLSPRTPAGGACDDCLRRTDLIAALAGWLDVEWRRRDAPARVLALPDEALLDACADTRIRRRYEDFEPAAARSAVRERRLVAICGCSDGYPAALRDLPDPPAVIHVAGDPGALADEAAAGVVGARRATPYGLAVAHEIGRGLSAAGVTVVSGLALGVDSKAHEGAAEARSPMVAVLAGGAETPYPAGKRHVYATVRERGCVVSEMPPGFGIWRWAFVARNRLIAALSRVLVVVEAAERSGSLTTADLAAELGRVVGAVPGRVTNRMAAGTHGLIRDGAALVRGPSDVLDLLAEVSGRRFEPRARAVEDDLPAHLAELLTAIGDGRGSLAELAAGAADARAVLAGLGELEARGLVSRGFGGRYERVPGR